MRYTGIFSALQKTKLDPQGILYIELAMRSQRNLPSSILRITTLSFASGLSPLAELHLSHSRQHCTCRQRGRTPRSPSWSLQDLEHFCRRPISPKLHPPSSGAIGVLILLSAAPHQSKAPSSEFRAHRSSDFKIRGAPSVRGSILGVQGS